jgi:inner membrane transporter RhtA
VIAEPRLDAPVEVQLRAGLAFSLTAMIAIQGGNALAVTLFRHVNVSGATSLRVVFGSLLLLAIIRPRIRGRSTSERRSALRFGVLLATMNIVFFQALRRLPLGVAVTLALLGPLTLAVAGSRRRADVVWPVLAAIGVLLIVQSGSGGGPHVTAVGVLLGLLSAACWGTYIVVAADAAAEFGGLDGLALAAGVAAVICVPIGLLSSPGQLLHGSVLALGAAVGALSIGVPYAFETQSLRRLTKRIYGVFASLEPAVATILGLVILGQRPALVAGVGILVVVIASAGVSMRSSEE